jgi:hypothetical protein
MIVSRSARESVAKACSRAVIISISSSYFLGKGDGSHMRERKIKRV